MTIFLSKVQIESNTYITKDVRRQIYWLNENHSKQMEYNLEMYNHTNQTRLYWDSVAYWSLDEGGGGLFFTGTL